MQQFTMLDILPILKKHELCCINSYTAVLIGQVVLNQNGYFDRFASIVLLIICKQGTKK